ncbi:hypothetical protein LQE88_10655 [Acidaminococcus sp. NSJ-142]|jgi:hypothetical protein|uniref:hypothetical protein n=1 Tax=Acidaminococcus TaxID=904 RepID=UPI000CF8DA28|nr:MULTISPECIES: hypothetical protein [Acidaminococcus]MCD2436436.1 hypothetical protein [Acidaminococcus hominis]MCH4095061.1 hypothetical protein [Acidaminococcus provencensis]
MSAFLGPIHHWLYGKIQLQEALIRKIAEEAEKKGWNTGDKKASEYVNNETRPLDELIDTMNIHGWLQERIHDAEGRYAALVGALLNNNADLLPELEALAMQFGTENALPAESSAGDIYRAFENKFLNGMPCDHVNQVTDQNPEAYAWEQSSDLHGGYWQEANVNPAVYYDLRDKMMQGMLADTAYELQGADHVHYVLNLKSL